MGDMDGPLAHRATAFRHEKHKDHAAHAALKTDSGPSFRLWNREFTIISGTLHYFRVPEDYWEDRLRKLRHLGANTVETCETRALGSVATQSERVVCVSYLCICV